VENYFSHLAGNMDIVSLCQNNDALRILNLLNFEDHHRILLPELLSKLERERLEN
jgi:hypothetical protein